jgi:hypothetical protein
MEENGYIAVAVKTAGGALPVEDAVVTVKDTANNILAVYFTDKSGRTPRLKVLAPPKANSESPGGTAPAFYNYNIDTDKEGFVSVKNVNVPVYPGITSLQSVELIPISESSSRFINDTVTYTEGFPPDL